MPGEDIHSWSTTAADNANADTGISWPEGMARAAVNDSSRALMAALAKDRDLNVGAITTGGLANAQTFLTGVSYTTIPTNLKVTLKIGATLTNTGPTTLNADVTGAVAVKNNIGGDLSGGELIAGAYADFIYDGTNWVLLSTIPGTVLLARDVITTSSTVVFTDIFTRTYDCYVFTITDLRPTVNNAIMWIQVSEDNGATWITTNEYDTCFLLTNSTTSSGTTAVFHNTGLGPGMIITHTMNDVTTEPNHPSHSTIRLFRTDQDVLTPEPMQCLFDHITLHNVEGMKWLQGAGYIAGHPFNALRFLMSPGNVATGNFAVYGVRK